MAAGMGMNLIEERSGGGSYGHVEALERVIENVRNHRPDEEA